MWILINIDCKEKHCYKCKQQRQGRLDSYCNLFPNNDEDTEEECSGLLEKDGTNGPALRQEACIRAGLTK